MLTLDLTQPRRPRRRARPGALGRRGDRVVLAGRDARAGGSTTRRCAAVKPDVIMLSTCLMGQTGPLASLRRLRQPRRRDLRLLEPRRLARSSARRPVQRLHRLRRAALHRRRDPRRARASPAHRRGPVHRPLAGRGVAALPRPGAPRLHGQRPRRRAASATAIPSWRRTASIPPRATTAGSRSPSTATPRSRALCDVMERPGLASDARFATRGRPPRQRDELDVEIAGVDAARDAATAIEQLLQARGVPASAVQNSAALCADPQLLHRGHFCRCRTPTCGTTTIEGSRFRLSRTPARIPESAPTYGRDNGAVLRRPTRLRRGPHHRAGRERGSRLRAAAAPARPRGRRR